MKRIVLGIGLYCCAIQALAMSVVFINPGKSDELYWLSAGKAMQAAADDLGVELTVRYAERNHAQALTLVREIIAKPLSNRPAYVIFSNELGTGPELLKLLDEAGIKTFMAFNGRLPGVDDIGQPRQQYKGWLGSLEPDAEQAGYLTARSLISKARQAGVPRVHGKLQMVAISGDPATPSSLRRSDGMRRAIKEAGDVMLAKEVYAGWSQERALAQGSWLYVRYPAARMVWAGNDLMAMGAMQAWGQRGMRPGKEAFFSGVNTSDEALQAVRDGRLSALAGGHFIAGAMSLVLLYDYDKGRDFAPDGLEQRWPLFMLFDANSAQQFMRLYGKQDFSRIDFRRYSKVLNPALKGYSFSFKPLLK